MDHPFPRIHLALRPDSGAKLSHTLAEAKAVGFDGIELSLPSLNVVIGGQVRENACARLAREVAASGLTVSLHAPLSLNLMDEDNAGLHEAVARATVRIAAEVGAGVLVLHPGWLPPGPDLTVGQGPLRQEASRLTALAEEAERHGLIVALENMPEVSARQSDGRISHGIDPATVAAQIRAVGHPALTGCLDLSHAAIAATARGADLATDIHAMTPEIGHIHLHNSFAQPSGLFLWTADEAATFGIGDTHLPLDWGTLDFDGLLNGLPVRPGTAITLEIMPRHQDPEVLADSLARARSLIVG